MCASFLLVLIKSCSFMLLPVFLSTCHKSSNVPSLFADCNCTIVKAFFISLLPGNNGDIAFILCCFVAACVLLASSAVLRVTKID